MAIYYYFLRNSRTNIVRKDPLCSNIYLGEVGDYLDIDGVGYYIEDYAVEQLREVFE